MNTTETKNRKTIQISWNEVGKKSNRYKVWQKEEVVFVLQCKKSGLKPKQIVDAFYKKFNTTLTIGMIRGVTERGENNALLHL